MPQPTTAARGGPGGRTRRRGAPAAEPKPPVKVEFEFDHIRERLTLLNTAGLTINNPVISPDGRYLLYSGARRRTGQPVSLSAGGRGRRRWRPRRRRAAVDAVAAVRPAS